MEEYASVKTALEAQDHGLAHFPELSEEELKAAAQFELLKADFNSQFSASALANFYHIESALRNTELFKFLRRMPKGAHLHVHNTASVSNTFLKHEVLTNPKIHYNPSTRKLSAKSHKDSGKQPASVYFQESAERMQELDNVISLNEVIGTGSSNDVWKHFMHLFLAQGNVVNHIEVFERYMKESFRTMREDGLQRVEYKYLPGLLFNDEGPISMDQEVEILNRLTQEETTNNPDFTVGYVYLDMKYKTPEDIQQALEITHRLAQQYPKIVLGFDLVGEEETLNPITHYAEVLANFRGRSIAEGRPLQYFFHAGESTNPRIDSIRHTLALGTTRIGHGINLQYFPAELDMVRQRKTLIELCPLSNMLLRYTTDLRTHPGPAYLRQGIPVSISSDDPGMFGYSGVTHDFLYATALWNLSFAEVKQLILYSIEHCTEPESTRLAWEPKWTEFVHSLGH